MNILLDNCVDWRAARLLAGHDVTHAMDMGWEQLSNGKLLASAASVGYEVIITVDKKIKYEQNLELLPLTVIEIDTPDSRLPAIVGIAQGLREALTFVARYRFISVDGNGRIIGRAERA
jgi:hypothetical protein